MCYERRRAEACVDESAHHALVSRLGIEPKTPGWLVQDPTTNSSGDLIPTIRGSGAHPGRVLPRQQTFFFLDETYETSVHNGSFQNYPEMLGVHTAGEGQSGEGR